MRLFTIFLENILQPFFNARILVDIIVLSSYFNFLVIFRVFQAFNIFNRKKKGFRLFEYSDVLCKLIINFVDKIVLKEE